MKKDLIIEILNNNGCDRWFADSTVEKMANEIISELSQLESEPEERPSDYDIENASTDYLNELNTNGLLTQLKQRIRVAYQQGAKDMRDNKIYISTK